MLTAIAAKEEIMKDSTKVYIEEVFDDLWDYKIFEKGFRWLDPDLFKLNCSKNFVNSFNQLQLIFNYNSNLAMLEDLRQENGMTTYGIDIPLEYFRFPYLNDRRQSGVVSLTEDERKLLESIVRTSKAKLNYSKDESIINEMSSRFEFLTLYSYFEGYCEEILINKCFTKDETSIKKQGDFIRHSNLLEIIQKVLKLYGVDLYEKISSTYNQFGSITMLFYMLRNLYTHRNGIVAKRFIDRGLSLHAFLDYWMYDENLKKDIYIVNCMSGEYKIFDGKNFNCQQVVAYFRAYATVIIEILNMEET